MSEQVDCIIKSGIVEEIDSQYIHVRIKNDSACSMCYSKGVCTSMGSGERVIDVEHDQNAPVKVGDEVDIQMVSLSGTRAVIYGYLLPFILMITALLISNYYLGEMLAALIALLILAPYYIILYLAKDRMRRHFRFTISR
jgi:sigma-E factor negative regulatory protein RseC